MGSRFQFGDIVRAQSGDTAMALGVCERVDVDETAESIVLLHVSGAPNSYQAWYLVREPVRRINSLAFDATWTGSNGWRVVDAPDA